MLGGLHLRKLCGEEGGAKFFGVFRVKNRDFTPKNLIFSNFRGGICQVHPPPWIHPCHTLPYIQENISEECPIEIVVFF